MEHYTMTANMNSTLQDDSQHEWNTTHWQPKLMEHNTMTANMDGTLHNDSQHE